MFPNIFVLCYEQLTASGLKLIFCWDFDPCFLLSRVSFDQTGAENLVCLYETDWSSEVGADGFHNRHRVSSETIGNHSDHNRLERTGQIASRWTSTRSWAPKLSYRNNKTGQL